MRVFSDPYFPEYSLYVNIRFRKPYFGILYATNSDPVGTFLYKVVIRILEQRPLNRCLPSVVKKPKQKHGNKRRITKRQEQSVKCVSKLSLKMLQWFCWNRICILNGCCLQTRRNVLLSFLFTCKTGFYLGLVYFKSSRKRTWRECFEVWARKIIRTSKFRVVDEEGEVSTRKGGGES